jgi:hypothetical protein
MSIGKIWNEALTSDYFHALGGFMPEEAKNTREKIYIAVHYSSMVAGYIPVVGTVVGIARMTLFGTFLMSLPFILKSETEDERENFEKLRKSSISHMVRGAFETTTLGLPLLFLPDLIFTIGRGIKEYQDAHPKQTPQYEQFV